MIAKDSYWNFRPKGYFGALDTKKRIANRIQGTMRRRAVEAALDENDPASVPPLVIGEKLDEGTRREFGRLDPAMMGGEYLPAIGAREVEIARIELESVTADVISIRALEGKRKITYRIVDEYRNVEYKLAITSSRQPLTLRRIFRLIQKSYVNGDEYAENGLAVSRLAYNLEASDDELEDFVKVTSDFYPQLTTIFEGLCYEYIAKHTQSTDYN